MKKIYILLVLLLVFSGSLSAYNFPRFFPEAIPEPNTYVVYVDNFDWGARISKIVLNLGYKIEVSSINKRDFSVVQMLVADKSDYGIYRNGLAVIDAYLSDSKGNKVFEPEMFVTLEFDVKADSESGNIFTTLTFFGEFNSLYGFKIENEKLGLYVTKCLGYINEPASKFNISEFFYDDIKLNVADWEPEIQKDEKIPLIVWFHGMGESGDSPYMPLLEINGTNLISEKIQKHFKNGAAVLVPQCPTGWLESTTTDITGHRVWVPVDLEAPVKKILAPLDKLASKFFIGIEDEVEEEGSSFATVSYYSEAVYSLIMNYIEKHPEIDRTRIYVGGCSAGGYMVLNMLIQYPELFAAGFPTCEAYPNSKIKRSEIKALSEIPLWFTFAKNDDTIKPESHTIPTVRRLRAAGAKNLHCVEFDDVHDLYGNVFDAKGAPFQFEGHASWIYVLNDDSVDGKVSIFEWLSKQQKPSK